MVGHQIVYKNSVSVTAQGARNTYELPISSRDCSKRGSKVIEQRGSHVGESSGRPVYFVSVLNPQKVRRILTSYKSAFAEQICKVSTLQDGRYKASKRFTNSRRLSGSHRPQGRLFYDFNSSQSSKIPSFHMAEQTFPICLPSIRSIKCPPNVYKNSQAGGGTSSREGNSLCFLSRRYPNSGQIPGGVHGKHPVYDRVFKNTRLHHQSREITPLPCSVFNLPGVLHQFKNNDFVSSSREGQPYCQSLPRSFASTCFNSSGVSSTHRATVRAYKRCFQLLCITGTCSRTR